MNNILLDDLQIDVADIWNFEQQRLRDRNGEPSFLQQLRLSVIPFYILKKHEPFVSKAALDDPSLKAYYTNYDYRLSHDNPRDIDYFKYREAFYDMNVSCVIQR